MTEINATLAIDVNGDHDALLNAPAPDGDGCGCVSDVIRVERETDRAPSVRRAGWGRRAFVVVISDDTGFGRSAAADGDRGFRRSGSGVAAGGRPRHGARPQPVFALLQLKSP